MAEVIMLLELITILEKKGRHIQSGGIKIGFDNKKGYRKIVEKITRSNMLAQEAGAEISMIKKLIGKIKFEVEI